MSGWLLAASKNSLRLFCAGVDTCPDSWSLLKPSLSSSALPTDIPTSELRDRHLQRLSMSLAEERAPSLSRTVRNWCVSDPHSHPPSVAVVISLYIYQDSFIDDLVSVRSQSQTNLERRIVDDCSSDDGLSLVSDWIDDCIVNSVNIFSRILLLSHLENSGLAAARNTAFSRASSSWCFVLDADNTLCPSAVKDCLALVDNSDPHLAVVHPLLAVHVESGRSDDQRSLVRPQSWQRSRFQFENHIDAMALVRRSAWKYVGGYTHIEGG